MKNKLITIGIVAGLVLLITLYIIFMVHRTDVDDSVDVNYTELERDKTAIVETGKPRYAKKTEESKTTVVYEGDGYTVKKTVTDEEMKFEIFEGENRTWHYEVYYPFPY